MMKRFSQWILLLTAVILLIAAVFYIQYQIRMQAERPSPVKQSVETHPDVAVMTVNADDYSAEVTAYGTASPRFALTVTAQVSGQVEELSPDFETGRRLKKGALLARLEVSQYKAAVAAAEKDLADARLALLEEQRTALQARAEWQASGITGEPESDLVLHRPQLAAAQAAVNQAEAALASARQNLKQTRITAPFDALVVERNITPGSYLQAGTTVATLYSTDRMEIAVTLSPEEWTRMPATSLLSGGQWPVELTDTQNGQTWSGRILRAEQHLEEKTRLRKLIVAVDQPLDSDPPLLPGTFVQARIKGRSLNNIWQLPGSALSQKGKIWYVKPDNTLAAFDAKVQFSDAAAIYISPPADLATGAHQILLHPLSSYLPGTTVNPIQEADHE